MPTGGRALTSDVVAARSTATALGLVAASDDALRDLDPGRWSGKALAEIAPGELEAWLADPDYVAHGGGSLTDLLVRVEYFLEARLGEGHTVVAVTHAAVLRAAVIAVLGAPPSAFWRIDTPPLTMLTLSSNARRWAFRGLTPPTNMTIEG